MRYDDTRSAFDCLRNCVQGIFLKSEKKQREELKTRLDILLEPAKYGPVNPNGFAPIRGYNLSNMTKKDGKSHWSFKRQGRKGGKAKLPKTPVPPPTADEIIAGL